MADPIDGNDITDDQINMVRDFELTLEDDPDPDAAEKAAALVRICDRALAGNPRDRGRVAATYNDLVADGSIPGVP